MGLSDKELAEELARRSAELDALRRSAFGLHREISRFIQQLDGLAEDLAQRRSSIAPPSASIAPPVIEPGKLEPLRSAPAPENQPQSWSKLHIPQSARPQGGRAVDVEARIGGTWLNRVGAILLLLGVAFFIKYSFDQGWISPSVRVMLGLATGVGLLVVGLWCARRGMRNFAEGVLAAGIAILYASTFGAHYLYHLVETKTALAGYVAITAVGATIAAGMGLLGLTLLTIIGAFLTPVAVSTGQNQQAALMNYLLVVDAGFLVVGWLRRWPLRSMLLAATAALFAGWYMQHYEPMALWKTLGYLTAFYLLFQIEALLARTGESSIDVAFVIHACNAIYLGAVYYLAGDAYEKWMGLFAATLGLIQFGAALAVRRRLPGGAQRALWMDGAAMLALAVPLQWDGHLVCVAWGIQAAVVLAFTRRFGERWLWFKAAALYIAATAHLMKFDAFDSKVRSVLWQYPLWNIRWLFVLTAGLAATMYAGAALALRANAPQRTISLARALIFAGCALIMQSCANQMDRYVATWAWLILAAAWVAPVRWYPGAGTVSFCIVSAACWKFIIWDLLAAATGGDWSVLRGVGVNRAVFTGAATAVSLWLCRRLASPLAASVESPRHAREIDAVLKVLAILVIWATGTFEIPRCFEFEWPSTQFREPRLAMHVTLSLFWGLFAMAMLVAGFIGAMASLRYTAIVLFALTTIKVLAVDISGLKTVYRIISFIAVGVLLLIASLVYQRKRPTNTAAPATEAPAGPAP